MYEVVFSGRMQEGVQRKQVEARLIKLFKATPRQVTWFLRGARIVVKSTDDRELAERYLAALEECGLVCDLREPGAEPRVEHPPRVVAPRAEPARSQAPLFAVTESEEELPPEPIRQPLLETEDEPSDAIFTTVAPHVPARRRTHSEPDPFFEPEAEADVESEPGPEPEEGPEAEIPARPAEVFVQEYAAAVAASRVARRSWWPWAAGALLVLAVAALLAWFGRNGGDKAEVGPTRTFEIKPRWGDPGDYERAPPPQPDTPADTPDAPQDLTGLIQGRWLCAIGSDGRVGEIRFAPDGSYRAVNYGKRDAALLVDQVDIELRGSYVVDGLQVLIHITDIPTRDFFGVSSHVDQYARGEVSAIRADTMSWRFTHERSEQKHCMRMSLALADG